MNATLKAGFILLVVFAIGLMAGIAVTRLSNNPPAISRGFDPFRMEEGVVDRIENRLAEHYKLSLEQRVAVRRILEESQKEYNKFFHETRPTFDRIRREQREAIRAIMTPEQIEAFDAWLEARRRKSHARREEWKREHGGPPAKSPSERDSSSD